MKAKHKKKYGFWNWGTGITITIITGAVLMLFLVYRTTTVKFEMAEEDYYAKELLYNDQLAASKNAAALSSPIKISQTSDFVKITVPEECLKTEVAGDLVFYRPSSQKNDLNLKFTPDTDGNIFVEKSKFIEGVYRLKADWTMNETDYHYEQSVYIAVNQTK